MATPQEIEQEALNGLAAAAVAYAENPFESSQQELRSASHRYATAKAQLEERDLIRERIDKWIQATRNIDNPTSCKGRVASDAIAILLEHAALFRMAERMRQLLDRAHKMGTRIFDDNELQEIGTVVELASPKAHADTRI